MCDHARIAAGVARAVGTQEIDVLGFSFGGMVAQQLARDEPDLVRRLALVATGCGLTPSAEAMPQSVTTGPGVRPASPY